MAAKTLLQGLLTKNVLFRLGGNVYDMKTIQQQCFFKTIDWEALAKKQVEAPFIPKPSLAFFTAEEELVLTSTYSKEPISEEIQGQFQELFKPAK
ncbi:serine/threonine-protein kinase akt-1-like [Xenopus laevis]|uniref:Serine/threonine-protein kinase akt-1-like n=1 Tax=Xenopus laevis TaxID=8355 RepID=A0A8J1M736_XENLA|nr:serine/threonine-protein kinase akt-1-like [Xenopus laevis]